MHQPGILGPLPPAARFLTLDLAGSATPAAARQALASLPGPADVVGLGADLLRHLGAPASMIPHFPQLEQAPIDVPVTEGDLWLRVPGADRGAALHASRQVLSRLGRVFDLREIVDGFVHDGGRDLTGYVDGTENPTGEAAAKAALSPDGSSVVAVQRWLHDLPAFDAMTPGARDDAIGRRRVDDVELEDAPPSAHVRRTAQEDFVPEAFLVRRSMPWVDATASGLLFVAFGRDLDAFSAQLRRMVGLDDGVVDALFRFTRPVTGTAFWCPPLLDGALDLSGLG